MAENQASNAAADVEMSQYVADRTRVNEDKIKQDDEIIEQFGDYNYGWHDTDFAGEAAKKGIDENVVRAISADKHEPEWMLEKRLEGYRDFIDRPMPQWGVDLKDFRRRRFQVLRQADRQAGHHLGGTARRDPLHVRQARHSGSGEKQTRLRRRRAVRVRGHLQFNPEGP